MPRTRRTVAERKPKKSSSSKSKTPTPLWDLRLYIAGNTPKSNAALENLKKFCEEHIPNQYRIEVIDLIKNPKLASGDQILAIPTLVKKVPSPLRKIIGDLSNTERVLVGFDIKPTD